jgi:hypothetical protein
VAEDFFAASEAPVVIHAAHTAALTPVLPVAEAITASKNRVVGGDKLLSLKLLQPTSAPLKLVESTELHIGSYSGGLCLL